MIRYVLKRLLMIIPVIFCVAVIIFTIMHFVPGDPAQIILGANATQTEIMELRDQMGLNDSYLMQLGRYLGQLIRLDFGKSYIYGTSVATELMNRFPLTLWLAVATMLVRVLVGTPLGISAAIHQNKWQDRFCMVFAMLGVSIPGFWLAMLLVLLFSVQLGWLPAYGIDSWQCWVLPIVAASIASIAGQARQTRSSMLEVIRSDYVTTARAEGHTERTILYRHALPNGLIPIIQVIGNGFGNSLCGALVIENVFSIPGMGVYLTRAVSTRDYPVVLSVVVLLAVVFSLIMLAVDIGFAFADPRIKARYAGKKLWVFFGKRRRNESAAEATQEDLEPTAPYVPLVLAQTAGEASKQKFRDAAALEEVAEKHEGNLHGFFRRLWKNKMAAAGLVIFLLFAVSAVLAPVLAPYGPMTIDPINRLAGPSAAHWFGTDDMGRDLLSRLMYGARYSLGLGVCATLFGMLVGVIFGAVAGYFGGAVDNIMLRFMDVFQSIPGLLLSIVISTALGGNFINTVLALGVSLIPSFCRMTRAQFLAIRSQEYVEAAEAIHCSRVSQIFKHMLPNAVSPLIVNMTMGVGITIMSAAQLSYIGLGVQPPTPEWGAMLTAGKTYMRLYPHMIIFPGLAIATVVFAINLFGDGLRDALDPKLKN